ncbi:DEKNAAC102136 [Brettanomyces naardenensis]|uniref:DEKNAAC102136 n=1 Tax=Brettanomyces naardenensis TaxID=13370 RepID=A0A448YJY1_BRENA|nr:DEKNAAC102136 [Brettanomyces naardenensis]
MPLIRREVKVKGIKDLRSAPKQVKLTYYEEEGADVDITLKLGSVVTFRKRRKVGKLDRERKKAAKEVRFVPSSAVLAFELMPANDTGSSDNAEYIHFRSVKTKIDRLSTGDYQLILNNLEFVDLPSDVDKIDYYMFLQDQIHSDEPKSDDKDFALLSSLLINNFKNSRFVDSSETVAESNNLENRCRRKEVKVEVPKWFIKRLMG